MRNFTDQQTYNAWLDSLYCTDTKEKHLKRVQRDSFDESTVLGRFMKLRGRGLIGEGKTLLPPFPKNSDPRTMQELRNILYVQQAATDKQIEFCFKVDDVRDHYRWWDRKMYKMTGVGYGLNYFWNLVDRCDSFVQYLKLQYVRVRPYDISDKLNFGIKAILDKPRTGSYPSGHSFDAWIIVNEMVKHHPEHRAELEKLALKVGESRMIAGLHYQSDLDAGRLAATISNEVDHEWHELMENSQS